MSKTVIYGAPGTGKTSYLIFLIKRELEKTSIDNISYLTFTKKAAEDAKDRISKKSSIKVKDMKFFCTIHSACYKLLNLKRKNVVKPINFVSFCKENNYSYISKIFDENELVGDISNVTAKGNILLDIYSRARVLNVSYKDYLSKYFLYYAEIITLEMVEHFVRDWEKYKVANNLLDFTDMLERVLEDRNLNLPCKIQLYDEQQDVFPLMYKLYEKFVQNAQNVYVAGDPNQSLYGFLGTNPTFFLKEKYDKVIVLPKTKRVPKKIWEYSKKLIGKSKYNFYDLDKVEPAEKDGFIKTDYIFYLGLLKDGETFILARIWQFLNDFREKLVYAGIPFDMKKGICWNSKLINIHNALYKLFVIEGRLTYDEVKVIVNSVDPKVLKGKVKEQFKKKFSERKFMKEEVLGFFNRVFTLYTLVSHIKLGELQRKMLNYRINKDFSPIRDIKIHLGTIHSVKGLEADNVILSNELTYKIKDLTLRDREHYEEELRVFYTGVTRAKENLVILNSPFGRPAFPM